MLDTTTASLSDEQTPQPESSRLSLRDIGTMAILITLVVLFFLFLFRSLTIGSEAHRISGTWDSHAYFGPTQFFVDSSLDSGNFPLWNSLSLSGAPLAANPLSMAFYPPNLIRSVLVVAREPRDTLFSLSMLSLFHALLFVLGMYGLARHEGISRAISATVALATSFSHHCVESVLSNVTYLYSASWTPLIILVLGKALDAREVRHRIGWLLLGGLLYGIQILSGFPQIAMFGTIAYVLYIALRVGFPVQKSTFSTAGTLRRFTGWGSGVALFGLTGALLAAALILPAAELFRLSARSPENFQEWHAGTLIGVHFWDLVTMRMRLQTGAVDLDALRLVPNLVRFWFFSLNIGLLILGTSALLVWRKYRVLVYVLMLYLLFDLCSGDPMPIAHVFATAIFESSASRYGSMLLIVPLGILAGFGLEGVFSRGSDVVRSRGSVIYLLVTGFFLILFLREPVGTLRAWSLQWALIPFGILILVCFGSRFRFSRPLVLTLVLVETIVCGIEIAKDQYRGDIFR